MSREYFISGIYGTFALSFWIRVFSFLNGAVPVTDPMLCSIAAGVLHGIGLGTLPRWRQHGGNGYHWRHHAEVLFHQHRYNGFVINLILLSIGAYCFGLAPAMYTLWPILAWPR